MGLDYMGGDEEVTSRIMIMEKEDDEMAKVQLLQHGVRVCVSWCCFCLG